MNAGSGDRGGIVSGFTGWNMGGIWVGGDGSLMGLVVGLGVGTNVGADGGRGGSIGGAGIGGGVAMRRVG
jgi:hypothetical protein